MSSSRYSQWNSVHAAEAAGLRGEVINAVKREARSSIVARREECKVGFAAAGLWGEALDQYMWVAGKGFARRMEVAWGAGVRGEALKALEKEVNTAEVARGVAVFRRRFKRGVDALALRGGFSFLEAEAVFAYLMGDKRNSLLALQMLNRYAAEKGIRFEDSVEVLRGIGGLRIE